MDEKLKVYDDKMTKTINNLGSELAAIRAGRANPHVLDKLTVDYYGVPTPIQQAANISVPEARVIAIKPFDPSILGDIEHALMASDIGITPTNDGTVIRLVYPELTEERRKELAKKASKASETFKVRIRNERRDANDKIKKMEKAGELAEDDAKKATDEVQKITDKYIKTIEQMTADKEKDIMEV